MADYFGVPKDVRDANIRLSGQPPFNKKDMEKVREHYKKAKFKRNPETEVNV